ncbi:MAG: hypothetical protein GY953_07020, partial [bacterium]|nr:hypothetical protein [bacterium]
MLIPAENYATANSRELLEQVARGHAALDHRMLHALLDEPERTVPGIVEFTSRQWDRDRIDIEEDVILMARHLLSPEFVPFLIDRLRADPVEVSELLQETIAAYGAMMIEPLLEMFDATENVQSSEVPFLLVMLGVKDPRIEQRLKSFAEADPEESSFCLEIYEAPEQEEDGEEPVASFDLWNEFPDEDRPDFENLPADELMEFLESPHATLRREAAGGLGPGYPASEQLAAKLLEMARGDADAWVRGHAWRSLVLLDLDEGLREDMLDRLAERSTPPGERAGLATALAMVEPDDRITRSIWELYDRQETRTDALEAMWRSMNPVFSDTILEHLDDADHRRREHAIMGVGHLGIKSALARLETMFDSEDFRSVCLVAYAMATPSKVTPAYMRRVFDKVDKIAGGLNPEEADLVKM